MKAIEAVRVGIRNNTKPPTIIPVPDGMDAEVFLAMFVDEQMCDGYKVVGSYGNANTVGMCKRDGVLEPPVLRIRIIEIPEAVEAAKAS
jgi:hypothetical protein